MKKKQESKYESFEETERKCILLAGHMLGKGMLKYANDPVGMHRDEDYKIFVDPFLQYLKGDISLEEAQSELNRLRTDIQRIWTARLHSFSVEIFYERKTGRNFWTDYQTLKEGDEKDKKDAAISLVSVFKPALRENADIKALLAKAVIEGDESFSSALFEVSVSECPDKKHWLKFLTFARLNEEVIKSSSRKKIIEMAKEQNVSIRLEDEEAFLRYIRRLGIKKDKAGRPLIVSDVSAESNKLKEILEQHLEQHKDEFSCYLFDPDPKEKIENLVQDIEKQLLNFKA
jgi:hypothetical protein